jgi:hypothetical protein
MTPIRCGPSGDKDLSDVARVGKRSKENLNIDGSHMIFIEGPYSACMRVLIVEDKVRMANLLQRAVQREGYATLVAHDGEAALGIATDHHLDALVIDVMLPKLTALRSWNGCVDPISKCQRFCLPRRPAVWISFTDWIWARTAT